MTNQHTADRLSDPNPHFVLIPLMAQGHMIPMVDMACLLAARGVLVSLITTPTNAARIKPISDSIKESGLPVRFIELRFPCAEAGLPERCENLDLIHSNDLYMPFFLAAAMLREPLKLYLREDQHPRPTCMISDFCLPWTMHVSRELGIPRLVFHGPSCFYNLSIHNIRQYGIHDRVVKDWSEPFIIPGLAHQIEVTRNQATEFFGHPGWENLRDATFESEAAADGVVVNSFDELEPRFIDGYKKAMKPKKVWAIGPFSRCNKDLVTKADRGNRASVDEHQVLGFLDSMKPRGGVIYVSFGSLVQARPSQLIEVGLGLEASNQPFIWVIKEAEKSVEVQRWLSEGFEERTRDRGLLIKGWAPQVVILSHPAVRGFLTHCGWNSTLEAVSAGVPMITWPHFADQFLNEKLVVEVLRIGIALGVKVPMYQVSENDGVVVKRGDVERAVVRLMEEGGEGEERRERAKELGKRAKEAMEEGGSSYDNLTQLLETYHAA